MLINLDAALAVQTPEELSDLRGVEYLFHEALTQGKLEQLIQKFPKHQKVQGIIDNQVLSFEPLQKGWETDLLSEVNSLIDLLPSGKLKAVEYVAKDKVNYDIDEMYLLNGELNQWFRKASDDVLISHQRAFLRSFFYGIDFTHWPKWALLLSYTTIDLELPTILRARRNSIDFAIADQTLVCSA